MERSKPTRPRSSYTMCLIIANVKDIRNENDGWFNETDWTWNECQVQQWLIFFTPVVCNNETLLLLNIMYGSCRQIKKWMIFYFSEPVTVWLSHTHICECVITLHTCCEYAALKQRKTEPRFTFHFFVGQQTLIDLKLPLNLCLNITTLNGAPIEGASLL